jgi:hypothetical protein
MKRTISTLLILVCLVSFGCNEDEVKTPGEKMSEQISKSAANVTKANVYEWTDAYGYQTYVTNADYSLEGQYIRINADGNPTRFYNMDNLMSFEISNGFLNLYFR